MLIENDPYKGGNTPRSTRRSNHPEKPVVSRTGTAVEHTDVNNHLEELILHPCASEKIQMRKCEV